MTLTPEQYEELAQRIVAQGVGHESGGTYSVHQRITEDNYMTPYWFCNDWRVAGAMMQKLESYDGFEMYQYGDDAGQCCVDVKFNGALYLASGRSLPVAINLACCDALETI